MAVKKGLEERKGFLVYFHFITSRKIVVTGPPRRERAAVGMMMEVASISRSKTHRFQRAPVFPSQIESGPL